MRTVPPFPGNTKESLEAWHEAALRNSEDSLRQLRALTPSEADRDEFDRAFTLMERQTEILRQIEATAAASDLKLVEKLIRDRIDATHAKDGVAYDVFGSCPVALPA